jgi:hypothetical protein
VVRLEDKSDRPTDRQTEWCVTPPILAWAFNFTRLRVCRESWVRLRTQQTNEYFVGTIQSKENKHATAINYYFNAHPTKHN